MTPCNAMGRDKLARVLDRRDRSHSTQEVALVHPRRQALPVLHAGRAGESGLRGRARCVPTACPLPYRLHRTVTDDSPRKRKMFMMGRCGEVEERRVGG
jgi:hypothetical protein